MLQNFLQTVILLVSEVGCVSRRVSLWKPCAALWARHAPKVIYSGFQFLMVQMGRKMDACPKRDSLQTFLFL
jgi:hypothetical protein